MVNSVEVGWKTARADKGQRAGFKSVFDVVLFLFNCILRNIPNPDYSVKHYNALYSLAVASYLKDTYDSGIDFFFHLTLGKKMNVCIY